MEFECREQNPKCFIIRKTLTEVADAGCLDKDSKALLIEGKEVTSIHRLRIDFKYFVCPRLFFAL